MMLFEDFLVREKKILLLFLSALLSFWLVLAPATSVESATPAEQAQAVYQITETQLNVLEKNLELLDQVLAQQDPELTTLQLQLAESKKELTTLRKELATSKEQLKKAEDSLRNANLYLEKCAQEEIRTRLRIKAQRNFWEAVAACLVVGLAVK